MLAAPAPAVPGPSAVGAPDALAVLLAKIVEAEARVREVETDLREAKVRGDRDEVSACKQTLNNQQHDGHLQPPAGEGEDAHPLLCSSLH